MKIIIYIISSAREYFRHFSLLSHKSCFNNSLNSFLGIFVLSTYIFLILSKNPSNFPFHLQFHTFYPNNHCLADESTYMNFYE